VKAELTGFKGRAEVGAHLRVNARHPDKVDLKLELGAVSETITVDATASQLLKTDRADVATTFEAGRSRSARARSQLHEVRPAHPRHPAANVAARASENTQASVQTMVNGQTSAARAWQPTEPTTRDVILGSP